MGIIESKLESLGFTLGIPKPPVANYLGSKRVGDLLFVSGRKSELTGRVGENITEEQAKKAAKNTVVFILAIT